MDGWRRDGKEKIAKNPLAKPFYSAHSIISSLCVDFYPHYQEEGRHTLIEFLSVTTPMHFILCAYVT